MEGHELLSKMIKVKAPQGFEEAVGIRLAAARRERARAVGLRYALAGSAALVLVGVLLFKPSPVQKEELGPTLAGKQALTASPSKGAVIPLAQRPARDARRQAVPVFETVDYASEFRNAASSSRTVYILEQVSEAVSSEIIY